MSAGRQLCHRAIDDAAALRRYADLLADFDGLPVTVEIAGECDAIARRLESLVPLLLAFEGEMPLALPKGDPW